MRLEACLVKGAVAILQVKDAGGSGQGGYGGKGTGLGGTLDFSQDYLMGCVYRAGKRQESKVTSDFLT